MVNLVERTFVADENLKIALEIVPGHADDVALDNLEIFSV